jgi:hypothetical protein
MEGRLPVCHAVGANEKSASCGTYAKQKTALPTPPFSFTWHGLGESVQVEWAEKGSKSERLPSGFPDGK